MTRPFCPCAALRSSLLVLCLGAWGGVSAAADASAPDGLPAELDALNLADQVEVKSPTKVTPWRVFAEVGLGQIRETADNLTTRRLSLDGRYDDRWNSAGGLRVVLSGRIDVGHRRDEGTQDVATLREAYVGWQLNDATALEFGRINVRHGVAYGYNPTDFFRGNALRAVTSPDPAVLRENRQGTVALQAQHLWRNGSITALVSPDLGHMPTRDAYSLDLGATNPGTRWLFAVGQRFSDWLNPQLLLQGGTGQSAQGGLNLAVPLGNAVVGFAELAWGQGETVTSAALQSGGPRRSRTRSALGLTVTTAFDLSLTLEAQGNSAGLNDSDWRSLDATQRAAVLAWADAQQDLPTRQALFLHALWKNVSGSGVDLAGYVRREAATGSRDHWLEVRYRWNDTDLALQWQQYSGDATSVFGFVPARRNIEVQLRQYF
ncbi:MAG: hypothetical protein KDG57_20770 [Rhodoferax sp.]|nr:hypothetical protein [Rhodoferax sp.]